jgi:hypothetical protein
LITPRERISDHRHGRGNPQYYLTRTGALDQGWKAA